MKSLGLEIKDELKNKKPFNLSVEEKEVYNFYTQRFTDAKNSRNKTRREFDDLTFEMDYQKNKDAMNSYLRKKVNDDEVRVNTGVAEKKVEFLINEEATLNLQPEIIAYDQNDNLIADLGYTFEDIVKRTNEIENDDGKLIDMLAELNSQRVIFVEEKWVERHTAKGIEKRCEKELVNGLQMFLGDMNLPICRFNEQPYIFKYDRMTYDEARTIFKNNKKFIDYVRAGMPAQDFDTPTNYRFGSLLKNEVEFLTYYSYPDNEFNIMANGILLEDIGTSLPYSYEGYPFAVEVIKTMGVDFAYGKSPLIGAKSLQALSDDTIRNIIRKFRQAVEPPIGIKSGKIYSRDIWNAGAVTAGISDKDFSYLINHQGVTQSEFNLMDFLERKISEFIGASQLTQRKGKVTATEILQDQKMAIKMMGLSMLALMRLKKKLTWLRIQNIIEHCKEPVKQTANAQGILENVYQKFSMNESDLGNGKTGQHIYQFANRGMTIDEQHQAHAYELQQEQKGNPMKYEVVNADMLGILQLVWQVQVVSKDKDSTELSKAMMMDKLNQASVIQKMTGKQLNADKLIDSFEQVWKSRGLFQKETPQTMGQGQPPMPSPAGSPVGQQVQKGAIQPNLNNMVGAV